MKFEPLTPESLHTQGLILFEAVSGSRAYGLDTPESDLDLRGIFMAPLEQLLGLNLYQAQIQDAQHNQVYYELGRFLELLGKNNPSVMEILASPAECVRFRHPLMDLLKPDDFISQLCRDTFGQYALDQVKKARGLNKKITHPHPPKRKTVLDCCFVAVGGLVRNLENWLEDSGYDQRYCGLVALDHMPHFYALHYDAEGQFQGQPVHGYAGVVKDIETACDVCLSSVPQHEPILCYLNFNKDLFQKYCREYKAYAEWAENRNEKRFQANLSRGKNYDPKNMMHVMRLLTMAEEIALTRHIQVRRPDRERLLNIREGFCDYDVLLAEAEDRIAALGPLYLQSGLPSKPDSQLIQNLLLTLRKRWFMLNTFHFQGEINLND